MNERRRRQEAALEWLNLFGEPFAASMGATIPGGVAYLLRDTFSADLAAGSVNGTLADTGQARTVVDTNSKLLISGGQAVFATGGAGNGDPGLWYPAVTTVSGTILICSMTPGDSSDGGAFGWDTNQSGLIQNALRFASAALQFIVGGTPVSVGAFTVSVAYKLILVQRPNGGYWGFAKGGSQYPTLKMVWLNTTGAAGSLFPGAGNAGNAFNADDIRIPQDITYIPQSLAYDTFTRADGALGSTETTGPDSQSLTAIAWQFNTSIWAIASGQAIGTPTPGTDAIVNGGFGADTDWTKGSGWTIAAGVASAAAATSDLSQTVAPLTANRWYRIEYTVSGAAAGAIQARVGTLLLPSHSSNGSYIEMCRADGTGFLMRGTGFTGSLDNVAAKLLSNSDLFASLQVSTPDVIVEAAVTIFSSGGGRPGGLVLNLDSASNPQNFILCYLDGIGRCVLEECVAGVYGSPKITTAITYSAGAVLRVIRDGTSCRVFYNGAAVSTVQTMTANTNVLHGLFSPSGSNRFDGFTIWARGTSGEYATLDTY